MKNSKLKMQSPKLPAFDPFGMTARFHFEFFILNF